MAEKKREATIFFVAHVLVLASDVANAYVEKANAVNRHLQRLYRPSVSLEKPQRALLVSDS